ncbi:hypothetical protein [Micromonospora avicenniae]|uniref:hypothetical protein n=1 Tax=Micromonospora avicenniae TaxID=1198245 RepID=UPI0011154985|nr:hypothetical protein [Micromonospora avicenniae]
MDLGFWLGLALSIPIGVLVNIATPQIQKRMGERSEKKRQQLADRSAEHAAIVDWFAQNPNLFVAYLIRTGFEFVGPATVMVALAVLFVIGKGNQADNPGDQFWKIAPTLVLLIIALAGHMIFRIFGRVIGMWIDVRNAAGWPVSTAFRLRPQATSSTATELDDSASASAETDGAPS